MFGAPIQCINDQIVPKQALGAPILSRAVPIRPLATAAVLSRFSQDAPLMLSCGGFNYNTLTHSVQETTLHYIVYGS
jgi:hypothetical protein